MLKILMSSKSILIWQNICKDFLSAEFRQLNTELYKPAYTFINESDLYNKDEQEITPKRFIPIEDTIIVEEAKTIAGNDPMPEEPTYPAPDDCCGSGCRICVYDQYELDLERYEKNLQAWRIRHAGETDSMSKENKS